MLLHPAKQFAFFRPSPVEGAGLGEEVDFQAVDAPAERPAEYVPRIPTGTQMFSRHTDPASRACALLPAQSTRRR